MIKKIVLASTLIFILIATIVEDTAIYEKTKLDISYNGVGAFVEEFNKTKENSDISVNSTSQSGNF